MAQPPAELWRTHPAVRALLECGTLKGPSAQQSLAAAEALRTTVSAGTRLREQLGTDDVWPSVRSLDGTVDAICTRASGGG